MSLPPKIKALFERPMGRYILVGATVYVVELVIIIVAQRLGTSGTVAVGLSFWLGLIISFGLQKVVTFGDKHTHHRILLPQILAVTALVICNFGFTILVTELLSDIVPATVTRTLALGITTLWNFYLYKTHIFKQP